MSQIFQTLLDTVISPISALSQMIKSSDAKIISHDGIKILQDEDKLEKVSKAIENFKKSADKSTHSKQIIVDFES